MALKNKTGMASKKGTNSGSPKKVSINDLTENDREVYQEIVEDIFKSFKIPKKEILDRMKKKKAEREEKRIE